jgi:hypothetical protein
MMRDRIRSFDHILQIVEECCGPEAAAALNAVIDDLVTENVALRERLHKQQERKAALEQCLAAHRQDMIALAKDIEEATGKKLHFDLKRWELQ